MNRFVGSSLLHVAAMMNHVEVIRLLIDKYHHPMSPVVKSMSGLETPVLAAAAHGSVKVILSRLVL